MRYRRVSVASRAGAVRPARARDRRRDSSSVCACCGAQGLPVYFLGGAEGVAADAAADDGSAFSRTARGRNAQRVISPKIERDIVEDDSPRAARACCSSDWDRRARSFGLPITCAGPVCGAAIGVGGSFDVLGGRVERAPRLHAASGARVAVSSHQRTASLAPATRACRNSSGSSRSNGSASLQ